MAHSQRPDPAYAEVDAQLETLAGDEALPGFGDILQQLGALQTTRGGKGKTATTEEVSQHVTGSSGDASAQRPPSAKLKARGGSSMRGKGRKSLSGQTDSDTRILEQAVSAVEGLMRRAPEPLPEENAVLERKVDEMSTVSSHLEAELMEERARREELEKRLITLEQAHSQLATNFVALVSSLRTPTKGTGTTGGGTTMASGLTSQTSHMVESPSTADLALARSDKSTTSSSRGVAGRRRGGL